MKSAAQRFKEKLRPFEGRQLISVRAAIGLIDEALAEEKALALEVVRKIPGHRCPECKTFDTGVTDTRINSDGFRYRRRHCYECGHRWNSIEVLQPARGEI